MLRLLFLARSFLRDFMKEEISEWKQRKKKRTNLATFLFNVQSNASFCMASLFETFSVAITAPYRLYHTMLISRNMNFIWLWPMLILDIYLFSSFFFHVPDYIHTQIWVTAYSDRDRIMPKYPSLLQKTNARTLSSTKTKEFQRFLCITDMHKCYNY